jgi:hypothetical protein
MANAKKSKKQRKVGRNANYCLFYKTTRVREKNQLVRLKKRVAAHPNDRVALAALDNCKVILGIL